MGLAQSQFDEWDMQDKAYAIQYRRHKNLMTAYESQVAEDEARRTASKVRK
jgi:hypothetical protein